MRDAIYFDDSKIFYPAKFLYKHSHFSTGPDLWHLIARHNGSHSHTDARTDCDNSDFFGTEIHNYDVEGPAGIDICRVSEEWIYPPAR
jgi:hypothetical protein